MRKINIKSAKKAGSSPGTLVHTGKKFKDKVNIILTQYDGDFIDVRELRSIDEINKTKEAERVKWISVEGLQDVSIIENIGKKFKLHPLLLEDILNTGQRAKFDDFEDYIFIVVKMFFYDEESEEIKCEQVSFVLIDNYIISFEEVDRGIFSNIRSRLSTSKGNIRKYKSDYLLYSLMDAIVDNYFIVLEKLGDKIDKVEDELIENPEREILQELHNLKREMLFIRNSVWPLREVVSSIIRNEDSLFNSNTVIYFRDVYDHVIRVIDTIEVYRDMLSGMLDTYLSSISNKTNDVMKLLTIISTIFIPITFMAGVYGMNFKNMPELNFKWGYELFWIISAIITVILLRFFKKKNWI